MKATILRVIFASLIASAILTASSAYAGWDDEGKGGLLQATSPLGGSINLWNCDDGAIAKWNHSNLTFKIVNSAGAQKQAVESLRAGVLEWNRVKGPYALSEVTSGKADITISIVATLGSPDRLGTAYSQCVSGRTGTQWAKIEVVLTGLPAAGIQNLGAHETGHALGLGHSDQTGDLMDPHYQKFVDGAVLICPSNLDVGALKATRNPYRISPLLWLALPIC